MAADGVPGGSTVVLDAAWEACLRQVSTGAGLPRLARTLRGASAPAAGGPGAADRAALVAALLAADTRGWLPAAYAWEGEAPAPAAYAREAEAPAPAAPSREGAVPAAHARDGEVPAPAAQAREGEIPVPATAPCQGHVWRADPVHLVAGLDHLRLAAAGTSLALTPEEARSLLAALDGHFAPAGTRLAAVDPARWYLFTAHHWDALTVPTAAAVGQDLRHLMPQGPGATALTALTTECQMLLAEHPVNEARAVRGLPTVNSLWCWGGSPVAASPAAPPDALPFCDLPGARLPALCSTDPELRGAWHARGGEVLLAPAAVSDATVGEVRAAFLDAVRRHAGPVFVTVEAALLDGDASPAANAAWLEALLGCRAGRSRGHAAALVAFGRVFDVRGVSALARLWPFARPDRAPLVTALPDTGRE